MSRATVIIVNWNGARLLPDCLRALAAQDLDRAEWSVWVVDNASSDDSVALLERDFPDVRVIRNLTNDGFAGGNNVALREVTTPYAVLLNNDATPEPDWLRTLLDAADAGAAERVGAVTSKILFLPRFLPLEIEAPAFVPGGPDTRELGVQLSTVSVDGVDVTDGVLWDRLAYGPEQGPWGRFRWSRPSGPLLVPLPPELSNASSSPAVEVTVTAVAPRAEEVTLRWPGGEQVGKVTEQPTPLTVTLPAGLPLIDVVNNAGGVIFADGYGADRGYQEIDEGQYDHPADVLNFCGAAVALRMAALREVGFFDDDFFLYYEDTDLSWRLQAAGWAVRYEPGAVVRHVHSATSEEWSPLFVFHVDRNRLLMLTKNATARLALAAVLRYPLTTLSMARTAALQGLRARRRPPVRPTLLRLRVIRSYLRLLPRMLAKRRRIRRAAVIDRASLQRRLTPREEAA